jgi:hypothetical protein
MPETTNTKTTADEASAPKSKATRMSAAEREEAIDRRLADQLTPRAEQERARDRVPPTSVRTELDFQRWRAESEEAERAKDEAYQTCPPGTRLYVTAARNIPSRSRAGVAFSNQGPTEVRVVDGTETEVAKLQATGQTVVTPMGAKAILDDSQDNPHGGLIVSKDKSSAPQNAALADQPVEALEAEIARRRRTANNPAAPTRLGHGASDKGDKGEKTEK